jgi:uroporphyrinogen decarboxylase
MRGFIDCYTDLANNPKLAGKIMNHLLEMKMAFWERVLGILGDTIDVVIQSDDLGGQQGLLISPRTYRTLIKPLHRQMFDFIHARSRAKIFYHSCGAVRPLIPDLIDTGVDILNPVQVSAVGMDTAELKREFGRDLTFWGGGVDTQGVLGSGSVQQVREEVKRRLGDLMSGGGFVFGTVHNVQGNVPPENIMAMWETVNEYGKY